MVGFLKARMGQGKIAGIFAQATPFQKAMFLLCLGWMHLWNLSLAASQLKKGSKAVAVADCSFENIRNDSGMFLLQQDHDVAIFHRRGISKILRVCRIHPE